VGVAGAVAPVHRYTSYEVAPDDDGQVSVAVVCVRSVAPLAGDVLITQAGTVAAAVVNVVVLVALQVVLAPPALIGAIYQLYTVPGFRLVGVYVNAVVLAVAVVGTVAPVQI